MIRITIKGLRYQQGSLWEKIFSPQGIRMQSTKGTATNNLKQLPDQKKKKINKTMSKEEA